MRERGENLREHARGRLPFSGPFSRCSKIPVDAYTRRMDILASKRVCPFKSKMTQISDLYKQIRDLSMCALVHFSLVDDESLLVLSLIFSAGTEGS